MEVVAHLIEWMLGPVYLGVTMTLYMSVAPDSIESDRDLIGSKVGFDGLHH